MLTRLTNRGVPTPCASCGAVVDMPIPLPRTVPLPSPTDDTRWGQLAAQHRPGCQWVANRGRPPAFDDPPTQPSTPAALTTRGRRR